MAAGLRLELSLTVLETIALANILTRIINSSVRNVKRLSALPERRMITRIGSHDGIRTHTGRILSPLSLPVGLRGHL